MVWLLAGRGPRKRLLCRYARMEQPLSRLWTKQAARNEQVADA